MRCFSIVAAWLALPAFASAADVVDYLKDIKPLLRERCFTCHGALKQSGKLRLDTVSGMLKGGENGPAITPGKPEASYLIERVTALIATDRMPPEGDGSELSEKQIAALKSWIKAGAIGPADEKPEEDPTKHWAFVKPTVRGPGSIDGYINADLAKHDIKPLPPAPKATLLRRIYIDLIGLPPTRDELNAFLNDASSNAFEKVVDRLLASPAYGERWARHWMDVWRYSDWYGRRSVPDVMNSYARIFRWRDWIVRSLNDDKGYNRMIVEMLAADEVCPQDDANIVATGFLVRNWFKWNYHQWMKDNVEHTAKAFLGLTLNCCHCHDHKYDPIKQTEYFAFRAFFEPLELRHDRWPGEPDPGMFQKYKYGVSYGPISGGMIRVVDEKLDAKTFMYDRGEERNVIEGKPAIAPAAPAFLGGDKLKVEAVNLPAEAWYPGLKPIVVKEEEQRRDQAIRLAEASIESAKKVLAAAEAELAKAEADLVRVAGQATAPAAKDTVTRFTNAVADARAQVTDAQLAEVAAYSERAAYRARLTAEKARFLKGHGDPAPLMKAASQAERQAAFDAALLAEARAAQTLLQAKRKNDAAAIAKAQQAATAGTQQVAAARANLAKDIATYAPLSPEYPQKSTGRRTALAKWIASIDNPLTARVAVNHVWKWHFGTPLVETTFDFGRNGKKPTNPELLDFLAVELMKSGWQMKALHKQIVMSAAYQRLSGPPVHGGLCDRFPTMRMEAEVIRDSVLHLAGELDGTIGGPEIPHEQGLSSKRRSLYFAHHGESQMEFLTLFDVPNPCDCYKRTASVLPQQALALSNSELIQHCGRALTAKLATMNDDTAFIRAAFEQVLTRTAKVAEIAASQSFLSRQAELLRNEKHADPNRRARENLIIALFNHNDFVTVR